MDGLLILPHIGMMVDERKLELDRGIKIIEEVTPVLKNRILIILLRQLIVNIHEAHRLGVKMIVYPADAVLCHLPVSDAFLRRDLSFLFLLRRRLFLFHSRFFLLCRSRLLGRLLLQIFSLLFLILAQ